MEWINTVFFVCFVIAVAIWWGDAVGLPHKSPGEQFDEDNKPYDEYEDM